MDEKEEMLSMLPKERLLGVRNLELGLEQVSGPLVRVGKLSMLPI